MATALDVVLAIALVARTVAGFSTGLAAGLSRLVGLIGGGLFGLWIGPQVVRRVLSSTDPGIGRPLVLLICFLVGAVAGEAVGGLIGSRIRRALGGRVGGLDSVLGAVAALVATSLVLWFAAATTRPILPAPWAGAVNESRVLRGIDAAVPDQFNSLPSRLTAGLRSQWPQVFGGLQREPSIAAAPPEGSIASTPAIVKAATSVVKVTTDSPQCSSDFSGSGWVVASRRVVTNAHVVAGASQVMVQVAGRGPRLPATVVGFDPDLDLAVLAVPGLVSAPLAQGEARGQELVAATGFPGGGSYTVTPSRVRGELTVEGTDIHGKPGIARQVLSVRGVGVRPGSSGGPLLNARGEVVGTVFAGSTVDPQTYYALTHQATRALLDRASSLTTAVSTQACAVG